MLWIIESAVFDAEYQDRMTKAIRSAGHDVREWSDDWWADGPPLISAPVLFHGSLGNAAAIKERLDTWRPGAYCDVSAFSCAAWYPSASPWLLHRRFEILSVADFVAAPASVFERLDIAGAAFVRPDSPLKPFSGRVLARGDVSLQALDHGFYYEDDQIPVVVAPVQRIGKEWRFVVVNRRLVAGSAYLAEGRRAMQAEVSGPAWRFAAEIAEAMPPPEPVYVLDVCEVEGALRLIEINPFSGADLYACDLAAVVKAVSGEALGHL